jgi:hypothetical protein
MIQQIFCGCCCNNHESVLAVLNRSALYFRWRHLDALLINVLKMKLLVVVLQYLTL